MPNELKRLSREDLYALVWAEPVTKVAARFGEAFGWMKTVAGFRKTRFRGLPRVDLAFTFAAAACDLRKFPGRLADSSPSERGSSGRETS